MHHPNAADLQLVLVALAFGGLQLWWIGSTLRRRRLAQPMGETEFRQRLERIWSRQSKPSA